MITNEPVLILTEQGLQLKGESDTTEVFFPWTHITQWHITKRDHVSCLIVQTAEEKKEINLAWLDKNAQEIASLIAFRINQSQESG